ncbi:hypothetical protein D3C78_1587720 [compost metagenome]
MVNALEVVDVQLHPARNAAQRQVAGGFFGAVAVELGEGALERGGGVASGVEDVGRDRVLVHFVVAEVH